MKKKIFVPALGLAAMAALFNPFNTINAAPTEETEMINNAAIEIEATDSQIANHAGEEQANNRIGFETKSGVITEISIHEELNTVRVMLDGFEVDFVVAHDTVVVDGSGIINIEDLEIGDSITAYYIEPLFLPLIYPARYPSSVLVRQAEDNITTIHAGFFADQITDHDGMLKINLGENTLVVTPDGEVYDGSLEHKFLVVYYTVSTRSIPAQTTPSKIIVLDIDVDIEMLPSEGHGSDIIVDERTEPNVEFLPAEEEMLEIPIIFAEDVPYLQFYVDGTRIEAPSPAAYLNQESVLMLPLRNIAEALGHTVEWNAEMGKIAVGQNAGLQIGEDVYTMAGSLSVSLGQAPEIKNGLTYVPLEFFIQVLGINMTVDGTTVGFSL